MATYEKNQLYQVPLAELQPDPSQPRKYMDPLALDELTASVTQMGIIEPVICRQDPETNLIYVVAGERRCAAARKANLPTVTKRTRIEIARKKQERGMLTLFRKFREQQAKEVARESGDAEGPAERKRSKAEAIANGIGTWANKICDLEFPEFSEEDRSMLIESMNFMKETLDEALPRAVENRKRPM